jgi:hypothetical protein
MGHTRVLYTNSTSAECGTVLKMLNFEEDLRTSCYQRLDHPGIKIYVVWGRSDYFPHILARVPFAPRVQVHFKTKDELDRLETYVRETAGALNKLDPSSRIQIFDPLSGEEILSCG